MKLNELLNTKKKKMTAGCIAGGVLLLIGGCVYLLNSESNQMVLICDSLKAELGEKVSTDVADYLDYDKISKSDVDDITKNTKVKDNFKYVVIETKDENGNTISKEEKDYPRVGNYQISFTYKNEKATVKVTVADTKKPEIDAPDTIDIIQYTDLSTFNFGELLNVTDYSDVGEWVFDTTKVDMNTVGTYDMKVSISDKYKNKATKKIKVNVVEAPAVAEGEVAVTEIVTDDKGNKKTVVTKKPSSSISSNDTVTTGKPVTNTNKVEKPSTDSSSKPSGSSGTASGSTQPSNGDTKPSKPSGGSTAPAKPSHTHNWVALTKTVHHDAQTKTVHHDAVTDTKTVTITDKKAYDEPIYSYVIGCKVCDKTWEKTEEGLDEAGLHTAMTGHSYTNNKRVQTGTKHHPAVTHEETKTVIVKPAWDETVIVKPAWDETITTGYKCSCGATK